MRILFTFSLLLFSSFLFGQTVCTPGMGGVAPTDEFPGCRMCVNVFSGSNEGYTRDADLNEACGTVENSLWLSFIADDSGEFEATFLSNSCTNNQGLELSLFDKDKNKIECFDGNGPGNISTTGLLPGEVHYVMIDGKDGDVCDFTFIINKGGTEFGAPGQVDEITADPEGNVCIGTEVCFTTAPVANTTSYQWVVPSIVTIIDGGGTDDLFVCVRVDEVGGNVIRVTPNNACFNGMTAIKQIVSLPSSAGPDIDCASTSAGMEFTWNALPGADSYRIFINGMMVTTITNTRYVAGNLSQGDLVNIRVQAEGDCSFQLSQLTCTYMVSSVDYSFVNNKLQVIPNPTAGNVAIETDLQVEEIEIYTTTGSLIAKETNTVFDLKRFGAGIYFLKIKTDEGVGVKRVLVN